MRSVQGWLWLLLTLGMPLTATAAAPDSLTQTDVFIGGAEGYDTFRIPSLLVTKKGTLLAFCEGRKTSRADHGDVDLVLKRSTDGGKTWGPLQLVHEEGGAAKITIGNPCPVVDRDTGTIWLTFTRDNTDVFVTSSSDEGQSWAKPVSITASVKKPDWTWYATGPGVGIQLRHGPHKGRLVIPCDHRTKFNDRPGITHSHVFWSDDQGKSWKLGAAAAPFTNECQVAELTDGSLLINMRNYWASEGKEPAKGKMRAVARSKDGGQTWVDLRFDKALIEPVCQASFHRYTWADTQGKSRLLFSNPASADKRHRMTVRLSYDEGETWPVDKVLEEGLSAYSCLADLPDGTIACLYERGQKDPYEKITLARFSLAWLTGGHDQLTRRPLVVGHRGLAKHAPENTLANFRASLELQQGIELDVRRTKDGQLVVIHDATVNRTTSGKGKVADFTLADLQKLDAGSWFDPAFQSERIPTLDELFALIARHKAGVLVAIDLKEPDTEADVVQQAKKHGVLDRLVFIGRAITVPEVRVQLRKADAQSHVACLAESGAGIVTALQDPTCAWVYVRHLPTKAEVARVHGAGKRLFLSGPKVAGIEPDTWKQAADLGIDAMLTDHPLELASMLRGRPVTPPDPRIDTVIAELDKLCRERTIFMIGPEKGKRLAELIRQKKPKLVVECGTAIGYSGLWIARELKAQGSGKLVTVEIDEQRAKEAEANFKRAGLADYVTIKVGDARKVLKELDGPVDFLFIDCNFENYHPCFLAIEDKLADGALLVADNAGVGATGMAEYLKLVRSRYNSSIEWFDMDLPWGKRDAMEITAFRRPKNR